MNKEKEDPDIHAYRVAREQLAEENDDCDAELEAGRN